MLTQETEKSAGAQAIFAAQGRADLFWSKSTVFAVGSYKWRETASLERKQREDAVQ